MGNPTIIDVANACGVSVKTVSRVLNDAPNVSKKMRHQVDKAIKELGYTPSSLARGLRTGTSKSIGIIVDDISDPFFSEALGGIEKVLRQNGYRISAVSSYRDRAVERELVKELMATKCAGLLIAPTSQEDEWREKISVPVTYFDRDPLVSKGSVVVVEDRKAAFRATEHLISHGHTRIAVIGDHPILPTTIERYEGYVAALAKHNIDVDDSIVFLNCANTTEAIERIRQLDRDGGFDNFTAILSTGSRQTLGCVTAMTNEQRQRIALVSFGDFVTLSAMTPPITVIDHNPRQLGERAAQVLLQSIKENTPKERIIIGSPLIARGSGEIHASR